MQNITNSSLLSSSNNQFLQNNGGSRPPGDPPTGRPFFFRGGSLEYTIDITGEQVVQLGHIFSYLLQAFKIRDAFNFFFPPTETTEVKTCTLPEMTVIKSTDRFTKWEQALEVNLKTLHYIPSHLTHVQIYPVQHLMDQLSKAAEESSWVHFCQLAGNSETTPQEVALALSRVFTSGADEPILIVDLREKMAELMTAVKVIPPCVTRAFLHLALKFGGRWIDVSLFINTIELSPEEKEQLFLKAVAAKSWSTVFKLSYEDMENKISPQAQDRALLAALDAGPEDALIIVKTLLQTGNTSSLAQGKLLSRLLFEERKLLRGWGWFDWNEIRDWLIESGNILPQMQDEIVSKALAKKEKDYSLIKNLLENFGQISCEMKENVLLTMLALSKEETSDTYGPFWRAVTNLFDVEKTSSEMQDRLLLAAFTSDNWSSYYVENGYWCCSAQAKWYLIRQIVQRGKASSEAQSQVLSSLLDEQLWRAIEELIETVKTSTELEDGVLLGALAAQQWDLIRKIIESGKASSEAQERVLQSLLDIDTHYSLIEKIIEAGKISRAVQSEFLSNAIAAADERDWGFFYHLIRIGNVSSDLKVRFFLSVLSNEERDFHDLSEIATFLKEDASDIKEQLLLAVIRDGKDCAVEDLLKYVENFSIQHLLNAVYYSLSFFELKITQQLLRHLTSTLLLEYPKTSLSLAALAMSMSYAAYTHL